MLKALLSTHSFFSQGSGTSSPRKLVETAKRFGFTHLALTDDVCMGGAVELHQACQEYGVTPVLGATLQVTSEVLGEVFTAPLVVLCASREGYAQLNGLITQHHAGKPVLPEELPDRDLFVLTGSRRGLLARLLQEGDYRRARHWLKSLKSTLGKQLLVQLWHDLCMDDPQLLHLTHTLAREEGVPCVVSPEIRYATEEQWVLQDALTCARLGINVDTPHPLRPQNGEQCIRPPEHYLERIPHQKATLNALKLASRCAFDLLPDRLTPADARIPEHFSPHLWLHVRTFLALEEKYPPEMHKQASQRLSYELSTIRKLQMENFFLLAAEVMDFCHKNGILASGRGSAAGSVTCYLLGITQVDPLKHNLLFERFLFPDKKSPVDIDIDISSSRRREVVCWVEERFGQDACEAMVANRITYRLPSAIQDLTRAMGLPPAQADELSRRLGRDHRHLRPSDARRASEIFEEVLGPSPIKDKLLDVLRLMERGFVRHLAPHSGGVILSREPILHYSPLQTSSGGIRLIQFDKEDIEELGLIKLDLLGLRMLSTIENALDEIERTHGFRLDLSSIRDHPKIWWRISTGDTLGVFQIESPGQKQMSLRNKPRNFVELAHQIALFRPGPVHSGTVHPYMRRKAGKEKVTHVHPTLKKILGATFGVVLFQEQVLRICHEVAGLDWRTADKYRKRVSTWESETELADLKSQFVQQAMKHLQDHEVPMTEEVASQIFSQIAAFRGYGFAESHAFAFARHAYVSAYLREFYPAEYLCGLVNHQPGMYNRETLVQEAIKHHVQILPLDINRSQVAFVCEPSGPKKHHKKYDTPVRFGLCAIKKLTEDAPRRIVLERTRGLFVDLKDFFIRVSLRKEEYEALILAGAFDEMLPRREALFQLSSLMNMARGGRGTLFLPDVPAPTLPVLTDRDVLQMDLTTKGAREDGMHIMDVYRSDLELMGFIPLGAVKHSEVVLTGGLVISRQKPPTANGVAFLVLQDGFHHLQVVISPQVWASNYATLRDSRILLVEGPVQKHGAVLTLVADQVWSYLKRPSSASKIST